MISGLDDGMTADPEVERELARHWIGDRVLVTADADSDKVAVVWQIALLRERDSSSRSMA